LIHLHTNYFLAGSCDFEQQLFCEVVHPGFGVHPADFSGAQFSILAGAHSFSEDAAF
jgi:hypothetical protein